MLDIDIQTGFMIVAASLFAAMSVLYLPGLLRRRPAKPPVPVLADLSGRTIFLFSDTVLQGATSNGLRLLGDRPTAETAWALLVEKLTDSGTDHAHALARLRKDGEEFDLTRKDGGTIQGRVEHDLLKIEMTDPPRPPKPPSVEQLAMDRQSQESKFLRDLSEYSPMLIWRQDETGKVTWANRPYRAALVKVSPAQPVSRPLFKTGEGATMRRQALQLLGSDQRQWFEVTSHILADGTGLYYALHADPVVRAEEALREFVQTLTKTFAHLPIGLAIFDKERHLALFNPALSELTSLSPEFLAGRPTLETCLNQLRDRRRIPEPSNFKSWKQQMSDLIRDAEEGTYEENWPLANGQTYRVTGRPHPEGAVAFLIEDITPALSLARRFRSELDLYQSCLDIQPFGMAVFSADGELEITSQGYADLWGVDPSEMLMRPRLLEVVEHWQARSEPSPLLAELRRFALNGGRRPRLQGSLTLKSGQVVTVSTFPLARGALQCRFEEVAATKPKIPAGEVATA